MDQQENWIIIAQFGRPHGVKGFVTVHSFTEPRDNVLKYANWHAFIHNQWQPIKLIGVEVQKKSIITKIEGYPDRESVARLTNVTIAVQQDQLESLKPGDYYWHQLIGMNVTNQQGEPFGSVTELIPTGANDVLVVVGDRRHLIPYLPDQVILSIDPKKQLIIVDWDLDF